MSNRYQSLNDDEAYIPETPWHSNGSNGHGEGHKELLALATHTNDLMAQDKDSTFERMASLYQTLPLPSINYSGIAQQAADKAVAAKVPAPKPAVKKRYFGNTFWLIAGIALGTLLMDILFTAARHL